MADLKKLAEQIVGLTLLEAQELKTILKDEYVIIGGHYDGGAATAAQLRKMTGEDKIYNNADDNASGTATVLELFEKYASENSNKRSLVFILFGGEELGFLGSKHYVENPTIDYKIFNNLAYGQWTLNEIETGEAWENISKNIY